MSHQPSCLNGNKVENMLTGMLGEVKEAKKEMSAAHKQAIIKKILL